MNWHTITISQGQAIFKANELEPFDRDIAIMVALFGRDTDYYESLPAGQLIGLNRKTAWINELPKQSKMTPPFRNGNRLYKFKSHPNQLVHGDFALLQKYAEDSIGNLHHILALLSQEFRILPPKEIIKRDLEKRAALFKEKMPFGLAYAYCLFFSTYYPHLLKIGLSYLKGAKEAASNHLKSFG